MELTYALTTVTGVNLTGVNTLVESFANLIDSAHLPLYDVAQIRVEKPQKVPIFF
jgi:hypothetical protein